MNSIVRLALAVIALAGVSLACTLSPDVLLDQPAQPADSGNRILFQDDFSDEESGWGVLNKNQELIAYENGGLRFVVNETQFDYWSTPGLDFKDVHIEVDATKLGGPDDNDLGAICRYIDDNNFYGFLISSDGYYGISKMKDGNHNILGAKEMEFSEAIRTGVASNHLSVDCTGTTLRLSVNDELLVEAEDGDFNSGDVGLLAGTFDTPGVDVLFDNFIVTAP